jgi:hypothetical protein
MNKNNIVSNSVSFCIILCLFSVYYNNNNVLHKLYPSVFFKINTSLKIQAMPLIGMEHHLFVLMESLYHTNMNVTEKLIVRMFRTKIIAQEVNHQRRSFLLPEVQCNNFFYSSLNINFKYIPF